MNKGTGYIALNNSLCFIETYWKNILLIVAAAYVLFSWKSCHDKNQLIADLKQEFSFSDSLSNSKIKTWVDKYGQEHNQVQNVLLQKEAVKKDLDSVTKLLNIKAKQVTSITRSKFQIEVHEKPTTDSVVEIVPCPEGDSISIVTERYFTWSDAWMSVSGRLGNSIDSVHVIGIDTLSIVNYWKRKWLLGPKHYYVDINNSNDHIKLTEYKGVQFREKEKKWSVGPYVGVGVPLSFKDPQFKINIGISVQYSLFRF
jgi:hypothetical protein